VNGGSTSLTSDIDLTVDFIPTVESEVTIRERLYITGYFISRFNSLFSTLHTTKLGERISSLQSFDLNLYERNFGHEAIVQKVRELNPENSKKFYQANRLSGIMLIYESHDVYNKYVKETMKEDKLLITGYDGEAGKFKTIYEELRKDNECSEKTFR